MLIETLDLLEDDVVVYSENKFDLKENYKIIYKQAEIKRPQKVDYLEVCNLLRSTAPKNIIVYRLLTSVNTIDAYATKYGYFLNSTNKLELVYFDPIFAIKDINNLIKEINPSEFRFKIQQVGYTTSGEKDGDCLYSEVYSFDLRAIEAQNQNDKVFALAVFALDDNFIDDSEDTVFIDNRSTKIIEDNPTKQPVFAELNVSAEMRNKNINKEKISNLKKSFAEEWDTSFGSTAESGAYQKENKKDRKKQSDFSSFLSKHKKSSQGNANKGIFSSDKNRGFPDRNPVVLKFK